MSKKEHPLPTEEGSSRHLQADSGEAVFVMDQSGQCQDANLAAATLIGYRPDEVRGMPVADLLMPDQPLAWPTGGSAMTVNLHHRAGHAVPVRLSVSQLQLGGQPWLVSVAQAVKTPQKNDQEPVNLAAQRELAANLIESIGEAAMATDLEGRIIAAGDMIGIIGISQDITEAKRVEKVLQESEALYSSVISALSEGVVVQDLSDKILVANESAARILGLTREQLLGKDSYDPRWRAAREDGTPFRPEDHPSMITLRTGQPVDGTIMHVSVGEFERAVISINSRPILDNKGKMTGVVATFADITAQKQAAEQYRAFFTENVSPVYWIEFRKPIPTHLPVDEQVRAILRDGYVKDASTTIAKMYGFADREAVIGKSLADVYHADYYDEGGRQFQGFRSFVRKGYLDTESEGPERTSTGQEKWFLSTTTGVVENGHLMRMWGTQIDITQRKETEQALVRLNKAIYHSPVSVVITDANGTIQYVNPKFCQVTGYTLEEVIGQNPRVLKSGEQSPDFYRSMWQTLAAGQEWQGEFHNRKKNGDLYWEMAFIAGVKDEDGVITHYVAVKEDITDRKRMEEEHSRQERLAVVGQLAAGIAHDFNNILAVITLYTQMMERTSALSLQDRERLGVISEQAWHASHLVEQILDFGRRSMLRRKTFDLLPFIKEQIKLLNRTLPEDIIIDLDHDAQEFMIHADTTRMQQILTNLAVNARDAMPNGGHLHIKLDHITVEPDRPSPSPNLTAGIWVRLTVADTGTGIAADVLPRIFDPFFTTKEPGKNSGLGLPQVHGIVGQHGGHINVASTLNQGTTFTIYLPEGKKDALPAPSSPKEPDLPQGQNHLALVVEDDQVLRGAIVATLESWDYRVIEAGDGQEALDLLAAQAEQAALVISDVVMPNMGGISLLRSLRKRGETMPIILMSGHPKEKNEAMLQAPGLTAWLTKPLNLPALAQAIMDTQGQGKP